jgi:HlyD family secretion protein
VDSYPEQVFTGTISQVRFAPKELQNVVSYATVIEVANPELMLRPGMTASIAIIAAHKKNILRVANAALRFKPDAEDKVFSKDQASSANQAPAADNEIKKLYRLWIINQDGKIQTAEITTGIYDTRYTEIATGDVKEGQAVIVGYQPQWRKSDAKGSFFRFGSRQ